MSLWVRKRVGNHCENTVHFSSSGRWIELGRVEFDPIRDQVGDPGLLRLSRGPVVRTRGCAVPAIILNDDITLMLNTLRMVGFNIVSSCKHDFGEIANIR